MFSHELKVARKWFDRIDKRVPCNIRQVVLHENSAAVKIYAKEEAMTGELIKLVEELTGAEPDFHPIHPEVDFPFTDEGVLIEFQV